MLCVRVVAEKGDREWASAQAYATQRLQWPSSEVDDRATCRAAILCREVRRSRARAVAVREVDALHPELERLQSVVVVDRDVAAVIAGDHAVGDVCAQLFRR